MKVDDLNIGQWIIVVERQQREQPFEVPWRRPGRQKSYDFIAGVPVRVRAICLPYIIVERYGYAVRLDSREVDFRKVDGRYRRAFDEHFEPDEDEPPQPVKRDDRDCPKCGTRRRMSKTASSGWRLKCPDCGFEDR